MKFRKKPVVIDAWRFDPLKSLADVPRYISLSWFCEEILTDQVTGLQRRGKSFLAIPTLEGMMNAEVGDWIIRGVQGEVYPCKPDIFELTYEKVEE